MAPAGPFKLCTVNNAPERAQRLVGRVVADMKDEFTIIHAGNAEHPDQSKALFEKHHPDIVFTASMWTPEQSQVALDAAREANPKVRTLALPPGLQVERGPNAVVEYIKGKLPELVR